MKKAPAADPVAPVAPMVNPGGLREMLKQADLLSSAQLVSTGQPAASTGKVPAPPVTPVAPGGHIVVFQKSGQQVNCDGEESILEVAEQQGVKIRSSCRSGACGTCKKKKIEGTVKMDDFDPEALEPDEQAEGYILTCVSFPQGRVVIDA